MNTEYSQFRNTSNEANHVHLIFVQTDKEGKIFNEKSEKTNLIALLVALKNVTIMLLHTKTIKYASLETNQNSMR